VGDGTNPFALLPVENRHWLILAPTPVETP